MIKQISYQKLFKDHISYVLTGIDRILENQKENGIVIDSGYPLYKTYDDQAFNHSPNFYFSYLCPDPYPYHFIIYEIGKKPILFYFLPDDFWHESKKNPSDYWVTEFDLKIIKTLEEREKILGSLELPIITPHQDKVLQKKRLSSDHIILNEINWMRSFKTEYEVFCIKEANKIASLGHKASLDVFLNQGSEFEAHLSFLRATESLETELPYNAIIAFNEKSAVLHYELKRRNKLNNQVFLIDAGVRFQGYCSDITRTYYNDNVDTLFKNVVDACYGLQDRLVNIVKAGIDYKFLQVEYQMGVGQILSDLKILSFTPEDAFKKNITYYFAPHGLGHPLGLQVHDVTGKVLNGGGDLATPDSRFPYLRTLRNLHARDVVTIEPGVYFIPSLLNKLKNDIQLKQAINWDIVEKLLPYGGVRVEDDILVLDKGSENLTRPFLQSRFHQF